MTSERTAPYLKSGMPLGVLMPAPTMTTTLLQALVRSSSATSCRESFAFSLLPPHPKPLEAPTERAMGLLPPVILTAGAQRQQQVAISPRSARASALCSFHHQRWTHTSLERHPDNHFLDMHNYQLKQKAVSYQKLRFI